MTWEYRVIHINVESGNPPGPPSPEADSERLGGALSPEFLKQEFPQQYDAAATKPRHPAEQLQFFLNALGKENWEMVEAAQVGPLLMFFFKRPAGVPPYPEESSHLFSVDSASQAASNQPPVLTFEGKRYDLNSLPDEMKELVRGMQVADAQLRMHEDTLKVLAVGRQAMASQLNDKLQNITPLP